MQTSALIEHLAEEGPLLAEAASRAGWDTPVPRTDWVVRDLVTHVAGVHRWAADVVRTGAVGLDTPLSRAVGQGPEDDDLLEWFSSGHADLVAALSAAPADLVAGTFLTAPSPKRFWARRQAHETAIHRADAQAASGVASSYAPDFAQDGIAELLHGFAARAGASDGAGGAMLLQCTDGPSWSVTIESHRIIAMVVDGGDGDGDVWGTSSDLYLWLWNRESGAGVDDSHPIAALWPSLVSINWS